MASYPYGQVSVRREEGEREIPGGALWNPGPGPALLSPGSLRALPTLRSRAGEKAKGRVGRAGLTSRRTTGLGGRVAPPLTSHRRGFGDLGPRGTRLGSARAPRLLGTRAGAPCGLANARRPFRALVSPGSFGASVKSTP